jgi:hypothetical protein
MRFHNPGDVEQRPEPAAPAGTQTNTMLSIARAVASVTVSAGCQWKAARGHNQRNATGISRLRGSAPDSAIGLFEPCEACEVPYKSQAFVFRKQC